MCPPKKGSGTNSRKRPFGCFAPLVPDPFFGNAYVKDENALEPPSTPRARSLPFCQSEDETGTADCRKGFSRPTQNRHKKLRTIGNKISGTIFVVAKGGSRQSHEGRRRCCATVAESLRDSLATQRSCECPPWKDGPADCPPTLIKALA